ncbi:hypothetical protein DRP05_06230 [Archaeoglobales archaeon]|nr:MAG: hypothetical protein DRP05_06230 [Archaeoglobales archaeon]
MARNETTPVNKAIEFLKIIILAMFFELEISYAVSEVNKRYELRKFLRIGEEVKLKSEEFWKYSRGRNQIGGKGLTV